jgi:heme exporter protein A
MNRQKTSETRRSSEGEAERVVFTASALAVSRGGRPVLANVSLRAEPGDAVVLRGPNGVGKTTLLRAFAGLLHPDNGTVSFTDAADADRSRAPSEASIFCGVLNAHKAALTVRENLVFWAALYRAPQARIEAASAQFKLAPYSDYLAGALSTGLARRLGLARLIIADRPVWFIDEPTAALDSASSEDFVALVEAHRRRGGIVVIATHDPLPLDGARIFELTAKAAAA